MYKYRFLIPAPARASSCLLAVMLVLFDGVSHAATAPAKTASSEPASGAIAARQLLPGLYTSGSDELLWLREGDEQAQLALQVLRSAGSHGIDPAHYGVADLERRLDQVDSVSSAALDRDLSMAMLQFIADVHFGRTRPDYRQPSGPVVDFDPVERLRSAMKEMRLAQAVDAAAPAIPLYLRVKATLAQYRELARLNPHWEPLPITARGAKLAVGSTYDGAALLRERLQLLGDLEARPEAKDGQPDRTYTLTVAAAVKRFQSRHGLEEDGLLGAGTLAALAVPPASRVQQLELTLERLRWLPVQRKGRIVVVNLPAYRLWAFDNSAAGAGQQLEMRVIVGTGARTPTPLFIGQMRYLEFNPYWNVPHSIVTAEIIPKLSGNSSYLKQNDMELVTKRGKVIPDATAAELGALRAGTVRVRQRPGAKNVLGAVKFAMPNPMNIYLHSTSSKELFNRTRRDLSHGCIRVEHPAELAHFVLADPVRWGAESVSAAMRPAPASTVQLKQTVPVVLFYATAITDRDGRASFATDIYRRDQPLIQAMKAH
jgi:murein L,D-transpeptidase YcbB/YkuD